MRWQQQQQQQVRLSIVAGLLLTNSHVAKIHHPKLTIVQVKTISRMSRFDDVAKSPSLAEVSKSHWTVRDRLEQTLVIEPGYDLTGLGRNQLGFPLHSMNGVLVARIYMRF
jgi:uncharacterized protein (DUF2461 family)